MLRKSRVFHHRIAGPWIERRDGVIPVTAGFDNVLPPVFRIANRDLGIRTGVAGRIANHARKRSGPVLGEAADSAQCYRQYCRHFVTFA